MYHPDTLVISYIVGKIVAAALKREIPRGK
jgi:hypothetical protein